MNVIFHLVIMLFAFMMVCTPIDSRADSIDPQGLLVQSTPTVSQDPQPIEEENTEDGFPKLSVPERNYQFESVPAGQTVSHDFIVYNKGTAPLHITRVKTG